MNRSKNIGTAAETKVVRCIRELGFGTAERAALAGNLDRGDITGTPGICWEVKGGDAARYASDGQITKWLAETEKERRNASAAVGVLVVARWKQPPESWWAIITLHHIAGLWGATWLTPVGSLPVRLTLGDVCTLLTSAGWGDPIEVAS